MKRTSQSRRFLLVVYGVVSAILVAGMILWLVMNFQQASTGGRFVTAQNNLRLIAIAMRAYEADYGTALPPYIADSSGKPMHSWRVLLLPYIDCPFLYDSYDFSQPWSSPANLALTDQIPRYYSSEKPYGEALGTTCYLRVTTGAQAGIVCDGNELPAGAHTNPGKRIVLLEVRIPQVNWLEPRDLTVADVMSEETGSIELDRCFLFGKGINVAYADGTVEYLSGSKLSAVKRLLSCSPGEGAIDGLSDGAVVAPE
jgi:hypothetical protein